MHSGYPLGDKVRMLIHAYLRKELRKIKRPSAITRLTAHIACGLMFDLVICKHRKEYGLIWHWMSLPRPGVNKQHKTHLSMHSDITFKNNHVWIEILLNFMTIYTAQKANIHHVTTMLATSKKLLFPGHNHLLTTGTDDPTLWLSPKRHILFSWKYFRGGFFFANNQVIIIPITSKIGDIT